MSVDEARERVLSFFHALDPEDKPILEAQGQVLAEDVVGRFDIPPLDNSAMDGYAVQADSVEGASRESPRVLQVTGTVAAGRLPDRPVTPGTAVRIMTGAPVPEGADAVVPFEDTDEVERKASGGSLSEIAVQVAARRSANIRPAGEDVKSGQRALEKGTVLRAAEIGVLASLGYSRVPVIRRPVAAILATGDELVEPGGEPGPGKIFDSNSYGLASAVRRAGGIPKLLGIAGDVLDEIASGLQIGLRSDILITSAGVSKGDYDIVKDALAKHGKVEFWSVRMRPAKPLAFGVLRGPDGRQVPHLGLPGNPVSAMVIFDLLVTPALYLLSGCTDPPTRPTVDAHLARNVASTTGREDYVQVRLEERDGEQWAVPVFGESNLITVMIKADGTVQVPLDKHGLSEGERVTVTLF